MFKKSVVVCAVWLIACDENGITQTHVSRDFMSPASEPPSSFVSHHWKRSEQWVNSEGNEDERMSLLQLFDNELLGMQLIDDFVYYMFLKG